MTRARFGDPAGFSETADAYAATMALSLAPVAAEVVRRASLTPGEIVVDAGTGTGVVPGSQEDFVASVASDRIFFDFDQYNVDAQDQATLQSQSQWLARNPAVRVTLEGHADERGTRDYNIALGERRANAAKNYLASLGVDPSRINVISYGKERPAALGSNEEAWAQNRRAVTVVIGR